MTIARAARCVAALLGAIAISACGMANESPNAAPTSASRSSESWMLPEAQSQDLLYLSDVQTNDVYVFSYPQRKLVGTLSSFGAPRSECVDRRGNVWIADVQGYDVAEYAHGGTKPLVELSTPWAPRGCSADPHSDTLAVSGGDKGMILAVYHRSSHNQWRDPQTYTDTEMGAGYFCGYDANGNLFIDGLDKAKGGSFRLAELPRRSKSLTSLGVSQNIIAPGQVQWDGKYLAIGDTGITPSVIYQFSMSGSGGAEVGSTVLDGTKSVRQFWIEGTRVVAPDYDTNVGIWKYPIGGLPTTQITTVHGYGAAVSAAAGSSRK
jgi:hypothetical protein